MGKRKNTQKQRQTQYFRWGSLVLLILFFFFWERFDTPSEWISPGNPPILYASQTHDNLRKLFIKAIEEAEHSIFLVIYSLSDESIIHALQKKASENIQVTVVHDAKATPWGYKRLKAPILKTTKQISGLMHQKILIVDEEKIWIGSANMTNDSLSLHDNLVVGFYSRELANRIIHEQNEPRAFYPGGQEVEFWNLPKEGKEGLNQLIQLIDSAKKSVKVAMFTLTNTPLTEAIIRAQTRGITAEVVIDQGNARGMSQKVVDRLIKSGVDVKLGGGRQLFHHKFLIIDDQILVNGSTNWTKAAFSRNADCFLIIKEINETQKIKLDQLWHVIRATSKKSQGHKKIEKIPELINKDQEVLPKAA